MFQNTLNKFSGNQIIFRAGVIVERTNRFSGEVATRSLGCFSFETCLRRRRWGVSDLKHACDAVVGVFQF